MKTTEEKLSEIETEIGDLIKKNDPRRKAIVSSREAMNEIDQKVDQKRKELSGVLEGEVLETAIKAYGKQLKDGINNTDLPEGSYSDLIALKSVFERFVSLLETEIRETTLNGKTTGRKGRSGKGAWFMHPEVKSEYVETGIYRVQDPYTGIWYANQNSAARAIQNNNP